MSNVRTVSQEDIDKYDLKDKQVGDVITAEEDFALRKEFAKKNGEAVPEPINPETGVTGIPSSIEGEDKPEESKPKKK